MSVAVANGNTGQAGGAPSGGGGIFDDAGATGAAGATGGDGGNAGASGASGGNGGTGATGGAGNTGGVSGQGTGQTGSISFPENWKDALDPTIRDLPFLKNVPDVPTLAKNYANAQAMIGKEKVVIPGDKATPEDWKQFYQKVGVPEKVEDYKFDLENKEGIDEKQLGAFKEVAHSTGLLPRQAKALADWFDKSSKEQEQNQLKAFQTEQDNAFKKFKEELGDDYNQTVATAKLAMNALPEETQKYFREIGMGKNPEFIKAMNILGKNLKEGSLEGGSSGTGAVSQEQALANIQMLKNSPTHAYHNPSDPGYAAARKEATQWYKIAFPEKKA